MFQREKVWLWLTYLSLFVMCIPNNPRFPVLFQQGVNVLLLFSYLFAGLLFLLNEYYKRKLFYGLYIWFFWVIAASVLNHTNVVGIVKLVALLFCASVCTIYLCEHDIRNMFWILSWMFTILLLLQAVSFVTHCFGSIFAQGKIIYYYFFGIRVAVNKIIPFALFFGMMSRIYGNHKSPDSLIISTACGLFFAIGEKVSTSLVVYAVFFFTLVVFRIMESEHFWRYITALFMIPCVSFGFMYAGGGKLINWFLGTVLNESPTLSGRTLIWTQALSYMKGIHWLIGNGYGHNYYFTLGEEWSAQVTHNQYLETVFKYGIIGMAIYIVLCIIQLRLNTMIKSNTVMQIFFATFLAMITMQIPASTFERPYYYIFYITSLYLPAVSCYARKEVSRSAWKVRVLVPRRAESR